MPSLVLKHTHIDIYGACNLADVELIERALTDCVRVSGSNLIHIHAHQFPGEAGVSGFALIAESHFSIHTWPEFDFAAIDFFTCGQANALQAVPVLEGAFKPSRLDVRTYRRGLGND